MHDEKLFADISSFRQSTIKMSKAQTEEESISNIASFIESTNPTQKNTKVTLVPVSKDNSEVTKKSENDTSTQKIGVHKLPVSAVSLNPIGNKISQPRSLNKFSGFAGISISRVSSNENKENNTTVSPSSVSLASNGENKSTPNLVRQPFSKRVTFTNSSSTPSTLPRNISLVKTTQDIKTSTLPAGITLSSDKTSAVDQSSKVSFEPSSDKTLDTIQMQKVTLESIKKTDDVKQEETKVCTSLPTSRIFQFSDNLVNGSVSVTDLSILTEHLNSDPALSNLTLKFMNSEEIRNLCDGVTALQMSGLGVRT